MHVSALDVPATIILGPADGQHERSPGLHLSQIYNHLDVELNGPKSKSGPLSLNVLEQYRAAGFVWEHRFNAALAEAIELGGEWIRPGEVERDGVTGSPDLFHPGLGILGETKFTWKSSRHLTELRETGSGALWVWKVQMMGYCYLLGVRHARLFSFFVNGDYKNMQPKFLVTDFQFSDKELRDNWEMLMNHARRQKWL